MLYYIAVFLTEYKQKIKNMAPVRKEKMERYNSSNRFRFTKIIATLGPSTQTYETIKSVIEAGADICRLNFSHDTQEVQKAKFDIVKRIEKELGRKIPVFADLQGPKLRLGEFKDGKQVLENGQEFTVDNNPELGDNTRVRLPNIAIVDALKVGDFVLIDDGKIKLQVIEKGSHYARTKVIVGGVVKDRKGFNLPNTIVNLPVLTEKDLKDLEFAIGMGVDLVAVSFVQTPDDLKKAKETIAGRVPVITKVEKPTAALDYLEEIVDLSDIVMIARGDMGVEVGPEKVPAIQKRMISVCREKRKPVIVATQMLESMTEGTFPTRAEATDVANAVYECADCTMLSAESASGKYPVEAVSMMDTIIRQTEADPEYRKYINSFQCDIKNHTMSDSMAAACAKVADEANAKAVFAYTTSGTTAISVSKRKPGMPIVAVTTEGRIAGKVGFAWGVIPVLVDETDSDKIDDISRKIVKDLGLAVAGDTLVLSFGKGTATSKSIFKESATALLSVIKA
jgi:pyruvate kinase